MLKRRRNARGQRLALLASSSAAALLIGGGGPPSALACYTGPFIGGYTNSGTTACIIDHQNFSGTLGNSGTISPGGPTGIAVLGPTIHGQIIDTGIITATGPGILINAQGFVDSGSQGVQITGPTFSGGISNAGRISGNTEAVLIFGVSTFSGGITNSGTISADVGVSLSASTFTGGISNSGLITSRTEGINPFAALSFSGGISNSGTISAAYGILVGARGVGVSNIHSTVSSFSGGIFNSGTITASGNGIWVGGLAAVNSSVTISTFSGGITNSSAGQILAGHYGIFVGGTVTGAGGSVAISSFSGGITNSGTISAATGIVVNHNSSALSIFDSGTIIGSSGTAVDLTSNVAGNTFTLGPGYSITGLVKGEGSDTFQLGGTGSGSFALSNIGTQYTGFTTFDVVGGVWNTTGVFAQSQTWNVDGGTLAGTGTFQSVNVNAGATLAPGTPGVPGTVMTISGSLAFASGAFYMVQINPSSASYTTVAGTTTLSGGTVQAVFASGSYLSRQYTILSSGGALTGAFSGLSNSNLPADFADSLSYDYASGKVFLNLTATLGALGTGGLNQNEQSVAKALNNYFNSGGTLPPNFVSIFGLTGASLADALTRLDGEDATGAEHAAFTLMTEFLELMLGEDSEGGNFGRGGGALPFAPNEQADVLPQDTAPDYDAIIHAPPPVEASLAGANGSRLGDEQHWSVWGSGFGGASIANGNAIVGSNTVTTTTYGTAAGMEYRPDSNIRLGFGLAGAGLNWDLAQGLGAGHSDAFLAGLYGKSTFGPAYLAGAAAFGNNWFTTNRIAAFGDQLTAKFMGQDYAARLEGGYRIALPSPSLASPAGVGRSGWGLVGITPYAAAQTQWLHTLPYSETDLSGTGFGLTYNATTASDTRSELGVRFDNLTVQAGRPLMLRASLAWAHDWVSGMALNAAFETLPGSAFTVNGASVPPNSALTSASAQYWFTANLSFTVKFDGEFAPTAQTYAGSGTLRYTW